MGTLNVKMNTGYQYGDAILDIRNELGCAEFDPTVIYNEGDKVLYKGTRYSRKSWGADTPAAESWDASHWTALDPVFDLLDGKVNTQQSVLDAGKALGIGQDGKVVPVPFSGEDFTGATSSTAGTHGYVPAPAAGDQGKVLMGGGNWSSDIPDRIAELENVCTEQDVTIQTSDWTLSNGTYTYEWSNSLVTSSCAIEVTTRDGAENSGIEYFDAVKSVGSITFTTTDTPTGSFPVRVTIVNAKADAFQSLSADEISSEAISDCDNVEEALTNLDGRLGNVPSGKTAQGQIDTLNSNINNKLKTDTATANAYSFQFAGRTGNDVIVNARCTNANYMVIPVFINGLSAWYGYIINLPSTAGTNLTTASISTSTTIEYDYYTRT